MGVIDRKNLENRPAERIQRSPSDDELSIPEELSEPELSLAEELQRLQQTRRSRRKPVQSHTPARPGKHCGKRRLRHYRAVEDLRSMWQDQDDVLELTIHDFMHIKPSPFAMLLQDNALLKAWWEFVSQPEEVTNGDGNRKRDQNVCNLVGANHVPMPPEYKRIEKHLKELLQRKSLDVEMVAEVELQLADFFMKTPTEILKLKKLTRYGALINQAICQYHGLKSETDQASRKRNDLFVSLMGDDYTQPDTALHDYLERRQQFYCKL